MGQNSEHPFYYSYIGYFGGFTRVPGYVDLWPHGPHKSRESANRESAGRTRQDDVRGQFLAGTMMLNHDKPSILGLVSDRPICERLWIRLFVLFVSCLAGDGWLSEWMGLEQSKARHRPNAAHLRMLSKKTGVCSMFWMCSNIGDWQIKQQIAV